MSNQTITNNPKRILMMAAGTGGHVFPALAVAKQLQAQGHHVQWLGTPHGMENRLLEKETDIPMNHVAMKGMRGNGIVRLLATPFKLMKATMAAMRIIKAQKVDVVAGFGGYVAAPGGLAAKLLGVPLVIHEQNAIAGMTNKYLAKLANKVLEAFPNTFASHDSQNNKVMTVGNPIRENIIKLGETRKQFQAQNQQAIQQKIQENQPYRMLVIGGSLGAQVLNENVPKALALIDKPIAILHQCGRGHLESTQKTYDDMGLTHDYQVTEFVQDMATAYEQTDILVCRAGASTVSEVAVAGVPAIFVPLPHAVDDHQTANAKFLSHDDAAKLMPQTQLTPEHLATTITTMLDRQVIDNMMQKTLVKGKPNATQMAVQAILAEAK